MDARRNLTTDIHALRHPARGAQLVKQQLGHDWSLLLDGSFARKAISGDIMFHQSSRTVYVSIFNTNNAAAEEAIERMIEGRPGIPVQMFDRDEAGIRGHAYLLPEGDKKNPYWGLNTWTASRGKLACVTIYFKDISDLDWAIGVWKSVRPFRELRLALN
jgi:hypothetical protein